ncbi:unannotated protein [freshwater metagenome]|uniref:Unannotated protein n=1 Tax=freshwater metagenome TaxID=449393 RepID=A0A6J6ZXI0_9ZZZZ
MQVRASLCMDDDNFTARLYVFMDEFVGIDHHEVSLERDIHEWPTSADHIGAEGQVWHKHAVHHIPLNSVNPGLFQADAFLSKPREICRKNRRCNLDGARAQFGHLLDQGRRQLAAAS